jgi:hypothetical protein
VPVPVSARIFQALSVPVPVGARIFQAPTVPGTVPDFFPYPTVGARCLEKPCVTWLGVVPGSFFNTVRRTTLPLASPDIRFRAVNSFSIHNSLFPVRKSLTLALPGKVFGKFLGRAKVAK